MLSHNWQKTEVEIILKNSGAARRFRWPVSLNGLQWANWQLLSNGTVVANVAPPLAFDANGMWFPISASYSGGYVEFSANLSGAQFPVTIDPTLTTPSDNTVADNWVISTAADSNFGTNGEIRILNGQQIGLVKYDLSSLAGMTLSAATQYAVVSATGTGTLLLKRILAANSGWTELGSTWNYAVASTTRWAGDGAGDGGADAGCSVSGTDFSATTTGSWSVTGKSVGDAVSSAIDLTELATMVGANYGFVWYTTSGQWRHGSSDHATAGYRPYLVVDYTSPATGNPYYAYAQQ
jgi:hypothetical protein